MNFVQVLVAILRDSEIDLSKSAMVSLFPLLVTGLGMVTCHEMFFLISYFIFLS